MARPSFRLLSLAGAALAAAGCASSSSTHPAVQAQNEQMSTLAASGPLSMLDAVTSTVVDPISDAIVSILPYENEASPDSQKRRMHEIAGPNKFRHEELSAGRDEMTRHREEFRANKDSFVSPAFSQSRTRLRSGDMRPNAGPILGSAITTTIHDPDIARTLLSNVGASAGVPVVMANPILAQLLPAFGN